MSNFSTFIDNGVVKKIIDNGDGSWSEVVVLGADSPAAVTFATLPATPVVGMRQVITDSTLAYLPANIGTAAVGGGTYETPVIYLSGSWVIGS